MNDRPVLGVCETNVRNRRFSRSQDDCYLQSSFRLTKVFMALIVFGFADVFLSLGGVIRFWDSYLPYTYVFILLFVVSSSYAYFVYIWMLLIAIIVMYINFVINSCAML